MMRGAHVLYKSVSPHWATPVGVYKVLDAEFHFTLDACPIGEIGGLFGKEDALLKSWAGERVFCNPPYGPCIPEWLRKGREADVAVFLLPARTDTKWWHQQALKADEIRFVEGRLRFGEAKHGAPFPSVIVIFHFADLRGGSQDAPARGE